LRRRPAPGRPASRGRGDRRQRRSVVPDDGAGHGGGGRRRPGGGAGPGPAPPGRPAGRGGAVSRLAYDVVVVGAGPAGSAAALVAARAGARVLLLERGEQAGTKNVSGAAFSAPQVLDRLLPGFWRPAPIDRRPTRRAISLTC